MVFQHGSVPIGHHGWDLAKQEILFSSFSTELSPHELPSVRIEGETLAEGLGIEQARIIEPTQHLGTELKEIRYRDDFGPFKTVEDLLKVKGIGTKTLEKLKPFIQIN